MNKKHKALAVLVLLVAGFVTQQFGVSLGTLVLVGGASVLLSSEVEGLFRSRIERTKFAILLPYFTKIIVLVFILIFFLAEVLLAKQYPLNLKVVAL